MRPAGHTPPGGATRREALRRLALAPAALRALVAGVPAAASGCARAVVREPDSRLTVAGDFGQGRLAAEVAATLAEARRTLADAFGAAPDAPLAVHLVRRFSTPAGVGAVARYMPPTRTIELRVGEHPTRVSDAREFRAILWHEYVHYLIHERAGGEPVPAWLDEGMAEYFGKYRSGVSFDAAYGGEFLPWIAAGRLPRLAELNTLFFASEHSRAYTAYAFAYSAVARLVERFGVAAPAAIVATIGERYTVGGALKRLFGARLADFESDWQRALRHDYGAVARASGTAIR